MVWGEVGGSLVDGVEEEVEEVMDGAMVVIVVDILQSWIWRLVYSLSACGL